MPNLKVHLNGDRAFWFGLILLPALSLFHSLWATSLDGFTIVLAGGSADAWQSFDNESVDLGQRTPEPIAFYKSHIAPAPVMMNYWALHKQLQAENVKSWEPQPQETGNGDFDGWLCLRAPSAAMRGWLGNFVLKRGENQQALHRYDLARKNAATQPDILKDVEQQIQRVASAPAGTLVSVLRNPSKE